MHNKVIELALQGGSVRLGVVVAGNRLQRIDFLHPGEEVQTQRGALPSLVNEVEAQIHAYARDPGFVFDLPLAPQGTDFQRAVWQRLLGIPRGKVMQYGEMAEELLGSRGGARAIGNACRNNPVPLVVPCHRVVSKQGLGGFAGDRAGGWVSLKTLLLRHEGVID